MNIIVKRATEEDAADLIEVQNKAFLSDYLLYGECPGYNKTNESMKKSIKQCHGKFYTFRSIYIYIF